MGAPLAAERQRRTLRSITVNEERGPVIQEAISRILFEDWDPIGVRHIAPRDEYDAYVAGIYRLLVAGASPDNVAEHLAQIERGAMGCLDASAAANLEVAKRLCRLDVRLDRTLSGATQADCDVAQILAFLNDHHVRATYRAVGEALGIPARAVGAMLGPRRIEASWVVSAKTGEPTGYERDQKHPLLSGSRLLTSGVELLRMMAGIRDGKNAG